jgi:hypothetical protein
VTRRVRIPKKDNAAKIEAFQAQIEKEMDAKDLKARPISTDEEFDKIYMEMTEILTGCSSQIFGQRELKETRHKIKTLRIRLLMIEIHHIRRVRAAARYGRLMDLISKNPRWGVPLLREIIQTAESTNLLIDEVAKRMDKEKNKERYKLETEEADKWRIARIMKETEAVLTGHSMKRLVGNAAEHIIPTIITTTNSAGAEVSANSPEDVKAATSEYLKNLFTRDRVPAESMGNDKPWLHCDAVRRFQEGSRERPFTWPPTIQTHDIQELLKKGTSHPSPGPDLWEKWSSGTPLSNYILPAV